LATGLEHPSELKLSQLAGHVRYVALETTDASLVGDNALVQLLNHHILVTFGRSTTCLLFDKASGRFVCQVGHVGNDPEGYSSSAPFYDADNDLLYFKREPNQLVRYDTQGRYLGTITLSGTLPSPDVYLFVDSLIVGHLRDYNSGSYALRTYNTAGRLQDSIPPIYPPMNVMEGLQSIRVLQVGHISILRFTRTDDSFITVGQHTLWAGNGQVRFQEAMMDTIYSVVRNELSPYIAFRPGKWIIGEKSRFVPKNDKASLIIGNMMEASDVIFFTLLNDINSDNMPTQYNVIYNKTSGVTSVSPANDDLTDDLLGLLPFTPTTVSRQGEFAQLINADKAMEWLDEHPQAKEQTALTLLKSLTEDDNPIVIIAN
jgi:hypothetical protein